MADKMKTSKDEDKYSEQVRINNDERHNENARAAAEIEPISPRISTDNL